MAIGTKPSASTEAMTAYGTIIGILTTIKQMPSMPAATLTKVDDYVIAAQNGTASYLQASLGFDPANEAQVTAIL
jgi:hypothetical protein